MTEPRPEFKRCADVLSWSRAFIGSGLVLTPMMVSNRAVAARILTAGFIAGFVTDLLDGPLARRSSLPPSPALDGLCDTALTVGLIIGAEQVGKQRRTVPVTVILTEALATLILPRLSPEAGKRAVQICAVGFSGMRLAYLTRLAQMAGLGGRAATCSVLGSAAAIAVWRRKQLMEYL